MSTNRNYAKLEEGKTTFAPSAWVDERGYHASPTENDYLLAKWKHYVDTPAPSEPPPEGYHYERDGWDEDDTTIAVRWHAVANPPPPPRRWSRLTIKTALATAGMLDAARQFLASVEIATGYSAWEALTDCDYIEEDYPDAERWGAILDGAAAALGKTRAEIDAFIDALPTE
jgi:hypothetical protein